MHISHPCKCENGKGSPPLREIANSAQVSPLISPASHPFDMPHNLQLGLLSFCPSPSNNKLWLCHIWIDSLDHCDSSNYLHTENHHINNAPHDPAWLPIWHYCNRRICHHLFLHKFSPRTSEEIHSCLLDFSFSPPMDNRLIKIGFIHHFSSFVLLMLC